MSYVNWLLDENWTLKRFTRRELGFEIIFQTGTGLEMFRQMGNRLWNNFPDGNMALKWFVKQTSVGLLASVRLPTSIGFVRARYLYPCFNDVKTCSWSGLALWTNLLMELLAWKSLKTSIFGCFYYLCRLMQKLGRLIDWRRTLHQAWVCSRRLFWSNHTGKKIIYVCIDPCPVAIDALLSQKYSYNYRVCSRRVGMVVCVNRSLIAT